MNQETKKWLDSPAFQTFIDLKYGIVGRILTLLQSGSISRSKAAEALAEVAHGREDVSLPEEVIEIFGEGENPLDTVSRLRSIECTANMAADSLEQLIQVLDSTLGDKSSAYKEVLTILRRSLEE